MLFIVCCSAACSVCYCQDMNNEDRTDSAFMASLPSKSITLKVKAGSGNNIPFSGIKIIDARFDTMSIGFTHPAILSRYEKLYFEHSVGEDITSYITHNYSLLPAADSTWNVVIVFDKCWITSSIVKDASLAGSFQEGIVIKANILAERSGEYHPLYKVDSIYTKAALFADNETLMIEHAIDKVLGNVINKGQSELRISKRALTYNNIISYISDKFDLPILNGTAYKKGIYKTFDEFKNNSPSIKNYEVVYKGKNDVLRGQEEDGPFHTIKNAWGFCDGTNLYICSSDNFFLLGKEGRAFITRGFKSFTYVRDVNFFVLTDPTHFIMVPIFTGGHLKDKKVPLQIDMETGELF